MGCTQFYILRSLHQVTLLFGKMIFSICMSIPNGLCAQTSSLKAMQKKNKYNKHNIYVMSSSTDF